MHGSTSGSASGNRFLRALPRPVTERIAAQLRSVRLQRGTVLIHAGDIPSDLYFPDSGLVSLVKVMRDGRTAEIGAIGMEGMVGVASLIGINHSTFETIVQMDGTGWSLKSAVLRAEVEADAALKALVLRYADYLINRLAQTAACNRLHTLRQRCCRWLLTAQDNALEPTFSLTHDFLAMMMGVNRPSLSLAIASLQHRRLIEYRRAWLTIRDRRGLESRACECYQTLREESERVYRV